MCGYVPAVDLRTCVVCFAACAAFWERAAGPFWRSGEGSKGDDVDRFVYPPIDWQIGILMDKIKSIIEKSVAADCHASCRGRKGYVIDGMAVAPMGVAMPKAQNSPRPLPSLRRCRREGAWATALGEVDNAPH